MEKTDKRRILAVDVLRGITICLMVIVNSSPGKAWPLLRHVEWNGMTPCDMVFPFFLFIMGVSICLSLSRRGFKADAGTVKKILLRTALLILACWGIFWFSCIIYGDWLPFSHFRLTGVLPRIAVSYMVTALLALKIEHKWMLPISLGLLAVYTLILLTGNGYVQDATNILVKADYAVLGKNHVYAYDPVDPEGLLGIIPSVAHAMLGFLCGKLLTSNAEMKDKTVRILCSGAVMLAAGLLLSMVLPLNKKIWSPSFVFTTCGSAAMLLSLLLYITDIKGHDKWCGFFRIVGVNSLFVYILSEVLEVITGSFHIMGRSYKALAGTGMPEGLASLLCATAFMLVCWTGGYLLYRWQRRKTAR